METKYTSQYAPEEDTYQTWYVLAEVEQEDGVSRIGSVRIRRMRECVAIGVAFALHVNEDYRRQGIARGLMLELERVALDNGITLILSTIRDDNPASASLVASLGYVRLDGFNNPQSGADVHLYSKSLFRPAVEVKSKTQTEKSIPWKI